MAQLAFVFFLQLVAGLVGWWLQSWPGVVVGVAVAGLATAAQARGVQRIFLQVEEGNTGARSLYRRAGFTQAWRYFYWSR